MKRHRLLPLIFAALVPLMVPAAAHAAPYASPFSSSINDVSQQDGPEPGGTIGDAPDRDLDRWPVNSGPGEDAVTEEAERQAPLLEQKAELEQKIASLGFDERGQISVDWDTQRLVLHWAGSMPESVDQLINDATLRFPVIHETGAYSRSQLEEKIRLIFEARAKSDVLNAVVGIALQEDLSGLRVFLADPDSNRETISNAIRVVVSDVPIEFVHQGWAGPIQPVVAGSRLADDPPFIGGARIERYSFFGLIREAECTSAFAVKGASNPGIQGMLTAKHCGASEDWYTPHGEYLGESNMNTTNSDITGIIWTNSTPGFPGFRGQVYVDGYTSSNSRGITGSGYPVLDEYQCMSGSFSGLVCSNKVIQRNYYDPGMGGPMHITQQISGQAAAGNGDSGGTNYWSSSPYRHARGIISAIPADPAQHKPCKGVPSGDGRSCSHIVYSTSIQNFLSATGTAVLTAPY